MDTMQFVYLSLEIAIGVLALIGMIRRDSKELESRLVRLETLVAQCCKKLEVSIEQL